MKPVIFGFPGKSLTAEEKTFFSEAKPFGFILFQRNIANPDQVRRLLDEARSALGRPDVPFFIDQEGGRVSRLKPPHWPPLPAQRIIGKLYEADAGRGLEAMRIHARIAARRLYDLGITCNCAPVLDLLVDGATGAIGDRAFSRNADAVAALGRVAVETYLANGVVPVIKHMPGHGRAMADPHETLPFVDCPRRILEAEDFKPFRILQDAPAGMNCHVVFSSIDPGRPVSLSRRAHDEIIRGELGFRGLLLSDDIAMKALEGSMSENARQALESGADIVLHCSGDLDEMRDVAMALPEISEVAITRWEQAGSQAAVPTDDFDEARELAYFDIVVQGQERSATL